jgi:flagellar biogenesis protein FliO
MTSLLAHFLVGIAVVGGLLWAVSRLARAGFAGMKGPSSSGGALRVVGRRQIAKGAAVVRVSVEDRDLLLGSSPKGIELLCELPKSPEPTREPSPVGLLFGEGEQGSFADMLGRSLLARRRR